MTFHPLQEGRRLGSSQTFGEPPWTPRLFYCSSPLLFTTPKPVGQQFPHWLIPQVYVLKRPHVDEFLQRMGELFECVLFTASLAKVSLARGRATMPSHPPPASMPPDAVLGSLLARENDLPPTPSTQTL